MMKQMKTLVLAVALSVGAAQFAAAYSEREGLDIYQRGYYLEAIEYWKKAAAAGDSVAHRRAAHQMSRV